MAGIQQESEGMRRGNTFMGQREGAVIDYILGNSELRSRVEKMRVEDSDHQMWIKEE